jgi:hypothetical protein
LVETESLPKPEDFRRLVGALTGIFAIVSPLLRRSCNFSIAFSWQTQNARQKNPG